ncbi:MAG: L-threonylcarbamoyladenylate synthase [Planctomycetota bacterium]
MLIASADFAAIKLASRILASGGLVAIPTETVYGLAASLSQPAALQRIYQVKGRPSSHPLIVHVAELSQALPLVQTFPEAAKKLADAFWPGPLTLVLPRSHSVPDCITAGHSTVGIRIPQHPVALQLLRELGSPIAAPSANRFTQVSPTRAAHWAVDIGHDLELILDGGPCEVGVESTVLDLSGPKPMLLRPGGISREALEFVLEATVAEPVRGIAKAPSPGQHHLHYSPRAEVRIATAAEIWSSAASLARAGRRIRVFTAQKPPPDWLAPATCDAWIWPADQQAIARDLYARFRQADTDQVEVLIVELPEPTGLGLALADRLRRAAGQG